MFKIPTGEALKGAKKAFSIQRNLELAIGAKEEPFGVVTKHSFEHEGRTFLAGWMGAEYGKNTPIAMEVIADPGQSADNKDRPGARIYCEVDGAMTELMPMWRKVGSQSGKVFYTGKIPGQSYEFVFWTYEPSTQGEAEA